MKKNILSEKTIRSPISAMISWNYFMSKGFEESNFKFLMQPLFYALWVKPLQYHLSYYFYCQAGKWVAIGKACVQLWTLIYWCCWWWKQWCCVLVWRMERNGTVTGDLTSDVPWRVHRQGTSDVKSPQCFGALVRLWCCKSL